eukprot:CAMPEP_0178976496 /NCGR_PEP_ID=MMETSP0789-20121207/23872_1 /TAXON_ID=3005 /ORGANISM="Rhizosolenia setigera, Strain CCMP 1694" /LENGTH=653 /DNA_ID=CAMNT_0020665603 /DNA_START=33 /DNA_END=1995 /DNA_ORIENTATION=-
MVNKSKIATDESLKEISIPLCESGCLEIHSNDGDDNSLSLESNENSDFSTSLNNENENENENLRLPRTWFVRDMPADDEGGDFDGSLRNLNARDETLFELPHAYPINFSSRTESSSNNNNTDAHGDGHNNAESNVVQNNNNASTEAEVPQQISGNLNEKNERRKIQLSRLAFLASILLFASSIPVLHRKIKKSKELSSSVSTVKDKVVKDSDNITQTTATNEIYVNETAKETFPSITNSTTNSPSASSTVTATPTATATTGKPPLRLCILNTKAFQILEYRAYERGEDPSKTFNYIFCPNKVYDIYEFDDLAFLNPAFEKYDFTSGNSFPLTIFRPNINILCGWNGDINNNCTFRGGWSSINIQREVETETISSALNTTAYNITIQGFRFTGSTSGSSIAIRDIAGSLTLKNCHFYNNTGNFASIWLGAGSDFDISIVNSIFENNTYTYAEELLSIGKEDSDDIANKNKQTEGIGVILSTSEHPSRIHVDQTKFLNNKFLLHEKDHESESKSGEFNKTSAVINFFYFKNIVYPKNLWEEEHSVEVLNSCFMENNGYSSALILGIDVYQNNMALLDSNDVPDQVPRTMTNYNIHNNVYMYNYPSSSSSSMLSPSDNCLVEFQYYVTNKQYTGNNGCAIEFPSQDDYVASSTCSL